MKLNHLILQICDDNLRIMHVNPRFPGSKGELGNGAQRVIVRTKIFQISRVIQSAQPVMHSAMRWLNCWRDHWCQWFAYDRREIDLSIF